MNDERRTASRSSRASTNPPPSHNVRDAALIGASSAFSKSPGQIQAVVRSYTGNSAASATTARAEAANNGQLRRIPTPNMTDDDMNTGDRQRGGGRQSGSLMSSQGSTTSRGGLAAPQTARSRAASPSNIAAVLAATRHSPSSDTTSRASSNQDTEVHERMPAPGTVRNIKARFGESPDSAGVRPGVAEDKRKPSQGVSSATQGSVNGRPTPPRNAESGVTRPSQSLEFGGSSPVPPPKPKRKVPVIAQPQPPSSPAAAKSAIPAKATAAKTTPQPRKPSSEVHPSTSLATDGNLLDPSKGANDQASARKLPQKPILKPPQEPTKKPPPNSLQNPPQKHPQNSPQKAPPPPVSQKPALGADTTRTKPQAPTSEHTSAQITTQTKPDLPPPRRTAKKAPSGADSTLSPSTNRPSQSRPSSARLSPVPPRTPAESPSRQHPVNASCSSDSRTSNSIQRQIAPEQFPNASALANAMVGASVAASRNTARSLMSPPPLPQRVSNSNRHLPLSRNTTGNSSPERQPVKFRSTMRRGSSQGGSSDTGDERPKKHGRGRRHFVRKHPNKHHEGSRKRWRDQITDRERKRYEGIWAANRGNQVFGPQQAGTSLPRIPEAEGPGAEVLDVAVREIWSRSRLPADVLAEVWDLVDGRQVGRLTREEFVVGMWLVDQRLKGRKLPVKVSDSVWNSARGWRVKTPYSHGKS